MAVLCFEHAPTKRDSERLKHLYTMLSSLAVDIVPIPGVISATDEAAYQGP